MKYPLADTDYIISITFVVLTKLNLLCWLHILKYGCFPDLPVCGVVNNQDLLSGELSWLYEADRIYELSERYEKSKNQKTDSLFASG